MIRIRDATTEDRAAIWAMLGPVIRIGETYALPRDWAMADALDYWFGEPHRVFVAELDGTIAGTYFLQPNQRGPGGHVANCGYVSNAAFEGRGVARTMCEHSLKVAKELGFTAMQFNCVVSTNVRAIQLWDRCGFRIVGTLPGAFRHPVLGEVDAYVMYQRL